MPYSCVMERGSPKLYPAAETQYRIFGRRDEQPFVSCASGLAGHCETMMVHRFSIECDAVRQSWAKIAQTGRGAGVKLPENLPAGFAPVSAFTGRIVLPSLARAGGGVVQVATQDLSPDSVTAAAEPAPQRAESAWTTTVEADAAPVVGGAFLVAGWVATLIAAMLGAGLVVAGRWRLPMFETAGFADAFEVARERLSRNLRDAYRAMEDRVEELSCKFRSADGGPADYALFNASLMLHAKLADAELALADLSPDLLLREVLQSEIEQARQRAADAERRMKSREPEKTAALLRALHRELDRILRIAQGAAAAPSSHNHESHDNAPQSAAEAYRVLGLNSDAPPVAVKKLIDALRLTWHPDHARDESDRQRREARMKQINAAWDMIRETRKAA